jgi:hypothetical protein
MRRIGTLLTVAALMVGVMAVVAGTGSASPSAGSTQFYCTTGFPPNGFTSFYTQDRQLVKEARTQGYMCTTLDFGTTVPQSAQPLPGPEGFYCTTGFSPNAYNSFPTTDKKLVRQAESEGYMCTRLNYR